MADDRAKSSPADDGSESCSAAENLPHGDNPPGDDESHSAGMTHREVYNVVSDLATGVNVRVRDNVAQAIAIFVCLVLGAAIGALVVRERLPGALVGGFVGLLVGLFGSGFFLMIYRAIAHARGRHD